MCFLFPGVSFSQGDKTNSASLFGTWILDSAKVDDHGTFPPMAKAQMELQAKGQIWAFNKDSTIMLKANVDDKSSGTIPFSISKIDGHTLLKMGTSVVELANIEGNKMDIVMVQGATFTMHFVKH
jgi:hypothetical protein